MAFENVNVSGLKNAIGVCRQSLDYKSSLELIGNVSNNDVWCAASRDNLKKAIETLTNIRYKELEKKLDNYLNVADMIGRYQILMAENADMQTQINHLSTQLYRTEKEEISVDGQSTKETVEKKVKDYGVQNRMDQLKNRININEHRMDDLRTSIASSI